MKQVSPKKELIVITRPSFVKLCGDPCKAALFDHILYQIAKKCKGEPRETIQEGKITYYKTGEELTKLMQNTWGVCKVRKAINELIDMGLFGEGKSPWGADRTKHFCFGQEQCRKFLELCQKHSICLHQIDLTADANHLMILSNGNDDFIKCSCGQLMILSNGIDESIEAITKRTTKRIKNERENAESQQNISNDEDSPSFLPSSSQEDSPSSQQTTKPEGTELSPEEQRIHSYWQELGFEAKIDAKHKGYWGKLAKHIKSLEDFKSLYGRIRQRYKDDPNRRCKHVYPGNLANDSDITEWKQWKQEQEQQLVPSKEEKKMRIKDMAMRPLSSLVRL